MDSGNCSRSSLARRTRSSFLIGLVLVGVSLAIAPTVSADPASGPGAVSQSTAGALPAGVIPDGTCAARVTAVGGGGASSPAAFETGGRGAAGASISATFGVLPGQSFGGSVGGGGTNPNGGSGDGAVGTGGNGGTITQIHRGGGGGGRTSVTLGGTTVVVAGGGGGGGAAHNAAPAGFGGGGGFAGIAAGTVSPGSNGQTGVDLGATANGGQGGQAAAGGAGGTNTANAALNGFAGGGIGVGTGGNGGPDPDFDSGGGGGGGYTGGGGGASTISSAVSGAGGGGGSSWVSATSPTVVGAAPTAVSGAAGPASPAGTGSGVIGSIAIDWVPCLYGLTVDKSVSSATANAGGAVTWTVTITNAGPDPMTRGDTVDLTDLLPVGPNGAPAPAFEVLTFDVSGGANANMSRGPVTCSGVTIGSTMPATTNCSRAYSAPGAPGAPSGGLRGLDPGETITITYEQIIANTAPCATITNTASAQDRATTSGTTDLVGVIATQSDSASLTIACYDLAITKVASPTLVRAGGTITWTVTVTNEGPGDMEGPAATDANPLVVTDVFPSTNVGAASLVSATGLAGSCNLSGSTVTCASGLPSGEQEALTFTQSVSGSATVGDVISNTASVTDATTGDTNDTSTDQATVAIAGLSLVKSADPLTYSAVGDVIDYDFVVTNTGDVTLSGPFTIDDDVATDETCPATATLAPAASITCTATHTINQGDIDAGSVTNTATASGDGVTSASDSATVTAVAGPALTIAKSADVATYAAVGDVISYEFIVTNSGNTTLSGPFTVDDDRATDESCPATPTLAPGNSITCTATYTITQADLDAGSVTNTASASNGTVTSNTDSVTVNAASGPGLSLVKTASPTTFDAAGDVIDYEYVVTNTGNVSLQGPVTVTDDKATVTCPDLATVGDLDANLDPGESITCAASYTVTQADVDADGVTNVATASAGGVDSAVESETVTIAGAPTPPPPTVPPTSTLPDVAGASPDGALASAVAWLVLAAFVILSGSLLLPRQALRRSARKPPK